MPDVNRITDAATVSDRRIEAGSTRDRVRAILLALIPLAAARSGDRDHRRDRRRAWRPRRAADRNAQRPAGPPARTRLDRDLASSTTARTRSRSPRSGSTTPTGSSTWIRRMERSSGWTRPRSRFPIPGSKDEAHAITMISSSGVVFEAEIPVAIESPSTDGESIVRVSV